MAPKRRLDEDAEVTESQAGHSVKRSRTLDQNVGEQSAVRSRNKIRFKETIGLPEVPSDFLDKSLATISETIDEVLAWKRSSPPLALPAEKIYRLVRQICDLNMEATLYDSIREQFTRHIQSQFRNSFQLRGPAESLRCLVVSLYDDLCAQANIIGNLVLYLDQTYSCRRNVPILCVMVFEILGETIADAKQTVAEWILGVLEEHRDGTTQKRVLETTFPTLLSLMTKFGIYPYIENRLFERTKKYYAAKAERIGALQEVGEDCLNYVKKICDDEYELARFFNPITKEGFKNILAEELVQRVVDKFGEVFKNSLEKENKSLLCSLYTLVFDAKALEPLRHHFLEYTTNKGNEIVTIENIKSYGHLQSLALMYEKSSSSYEQQHKAKVGDLVQLRYRLESICAECFDNNDVFLGAVSNAYRIILSGGKREALYARLFAEYLDNFLKSSPSQATFESHVKVVARTLKHNEQMQLFVENYSYNLGKRLLFPPSVADYSIERESFIVSQLKEHCSSEVISIVRMLEDITSRSAALNEKFREAPPEQSEIPLYDSQAVNVTVLSQPEWPDFEKNSDDNIAIPKEIEQYEEKFKSYYTDKFDKLRDLHWPNNLGTWTLKAYFAAGEKEIEGTKLQVTILMQFSEADSLSLEEIMERTRISNPTKILESLVKQNILIKVIKENNGDSVSYAINDGFTSEHYRVKVSDVVYEDILKEKKPSKLAPLQRYKKQVQAAIVHLMKRSRVDEGYTTHELFKLIEAQKVRPDFTESDFKLCVNGLIISKHIRKSEDDPDVLIYIP